MWFDKDKKFLTEQNGMGGYELQICKSCHPGENGKACGICPHFQAAIERLGAYEASGCSPKGVQKLRAKELKLQDVRIRKLVPWTCQHCEVLGICRDLDSDDMKCRNGCLVLNAERKENEDEAPLD